MKIKAHIHRVEDIGDSLRIVAQGTAEKAPDWMDSMLHLEIQMPNTHTNLKAFTLGRDIEIIVRPK